MKKTALEHSQWSYLYGIISECISELMGTVDYRDRVVNTNLQ